MDLNRGKIFKKLNKKAKLIIDGKCKEEVLWKIDEAITEQNDDKLDKLKNTISLKISEILQIQNFSKGLWENKKNKKKKK